MPKLVRTVTGVVICAEEGNFMVRLADGREGILDPTRYIGMTSSAADVHHFETAEVQMPRPPVLGECVRAAKFIKTPEPAYLSNWTYEAEIAPGTSSMPVEPVPPAPTKDAAGGKGKVQKKAADPSLAFASAFREIAAASEQLRVSFHRASFIEVPSALHDADGKNPKPGFYPSHACLQFDRIDTPGRESEERAIVRDVKDSYTDVRDYLSIEETAFVVCRQGVVYLADRFIVNGFHSIDPSGEARVVRNFDTSSIAADGFWYLQDGQWNSANPSIWTASLSIKSDTKRSFLVFRSSAGELVKAAKPIEFSGNPLPYVVLRVASPEEVTMYKDSKGLKREPDDAYFDVLLRTPSAR